MANMLTLSVLKNVEKILEDLAKSLRDPTRDVVVVGVDVYAFENDSTCVVIADAPGVLYPVHGNNWIPAIGEIVTLHMPLDDYWYVTQFAREEAP